MAGFKNSVLVAVFILGFNTTTYVHAQVEAVSLQQTKEQAPIWIDVRTPAEFESGHVSDAINIEYQNLGSAIMSIAPNKGTPINLYCRSGRRSEIARQTLLNMGYTNVINQGAYESVKKTLTKN
ncbi:MAG: rhodanese-like domain-containing protein [Advenella sp.]